MALYYNLPVYKDTYQLIMLIYEVTRQFPREYKYSLGQDMKRDAMELVRSIYRANRSLEKKRFLEEYLEQFELLKLEIRIAHDLWVLGLKNYADISVLMDNIGKQVTGWKNYVENTYNIRKKMLRHFSAYWWNHVYMKKGYVTLKYRRVNKIKQS